jgi:hypothetical protein
MKLNQLVANPQLIKCEINDEDTIKEFGEPLEWWVWDRQPISTFMRFAGSDVTSGEQIMSIMKDMILDEQGQPLLKGEATLPTAVLMRVMNKMTEVLGK